MTALLVTLIAPAVGALVAVALPGTADRAARVLGTLAAAAAFVASALLLAYRPSQSPSGVLSPWVELDVAWATGLDLRLHLGVDGVSFPLVVLTTLLTLLCALHTCFRVPEPGRGRLLMAALLAVEFGVVGVFLALDLVLFFVFFEVVLAPMYAVIAVWGDEGRRQAARKFLLYTLFGSVLLLVGIFTVVVSAGTADLVTLTANRGAGMAHGVQLAAFALLAIAFAVKSPLWPLHTWLPDAHTQAPTVGSVLLAGVLLKMGTYGLLRVVCITPSGAESLAPLLGVLAAGAIVIGGLVCLAQQELKRLIAYSSVGHMGFVLLGIATLEPAGAQAALIGNIAHGIITGLLFFLVGAVKDRTHTDALHRLGWMRDVAPGLAGLLGYAAIASLGLPGLAGFWGEAFAVFAAIDRGGPLWTVLGCVAAVGAALAAAYFLRMLRLVTARRPESVPSEALAYVPVQASAHVPAHQVAAYVPAQAPAFVLSGWELVTWAPLVALALVLGLMPALVTELAAAAVATSGVTP